MPNKVIISFSLKLHRKRTNRMSIILNWCNFLSFWFCIQSVIDRWWVKCASSFIIFNYWIAKLLFAPFHFKVINSIQIKQWTEMDFKFVYKQSKTTSRWIIVLPPDVDIFVTEKKKLPSQASTEEKIKFLVPKHKLNRKKKCSLLPVVRPHNGRQTIGKHHVWEENFFQSKEWNEEA